MLVFGCFPLDCNTVLTRKALSCTFGATLVFKITKVVYLFKQSKFSYFHPILLRNGADTWRIKWLIGTVEVL